MSWTHVPREFNGENVPSCYSTVWRLYTQHKPEVVDYYEPFRDLLHQILQVLLQRESFEEITTTAALLQKFCWLLASMLF